MDAATLPDTDELLPPVAHTIWDMKYRFKERDGTPVDRTMEDTRERVARFLAENDTEKKMFMDAMHGWKFLPAGRILAGAGTDRRVTNINCFVLGRIDDSLDGIMKDDDNRSQMTPRTSSSTHSATSRTGSTASSRTHTKPKPPTRPSTKPSP